MSRKIPKHLIRSVFEQLERLVNGEINQMSVETSETRYFVKGKQSEVEGSGEIPREKEVQT